MSAYKPQAGDRLETISREAFQGEPGSQFRLAESYRFGYFSLKIDENQALFWYKKAAAQGHRPSIFLLNNWRNRDKFV